jgi:methyl-accepting chemotaxis protein
MVTKRVPSENRAGASADSISKIINEIHVVSSMTLVASPAEQTSSGIEELTAVIGELANNARIPAGSASKLKVEIETFKV